MLERRGTASARAAFEGAVHRVYPKTALAAGLAMALTLLALPQQMKEAMAADAPGAVRERELVRFVRQECGFCHGLRLTGGLGTPLTAAALADMPVEALASTILYGRRGTAMPGWAPYLSPADAHWIAEQLLKGFPE
jgi:cytochrome c55X